MDNHDEVPRRAFDAKRAPALAVRWWWNETKFSAKKPPDCDFDSDSDSGSDADADADADAGAGADADVEAVR